jgi:hypothetical protein
MQCLEQYSTILKRLNTITCNNQIITAIFFSLKEIYATETANEYQLFASLKAFMKLKRPIIVVKLSMTELSSYLL